MRASVALYSGALLSAAALFILFARWTSIVHPVVIALAGLTPLAIAPLAVAGGCWAICGHRALGVVIVSTMVIWLATVSPWNGVVGCRNEPGVPDVTVLTMNTFLGQADPQRIVDVIAEHDPDVFVLQETTPALVRDLRADSRLDRYGSRSEVVLTDVVGVIMWSRHPWRDLRKFETGRRSVPQAVIEAPQGEFSVTAVHAPAPTSGNFANRWKQQFDDLRTLRPDTRHLLVGDFNASEDHGVFRRLLSEGWTDVHESKGCGLDATWPVDRGLPFAVLRLDHILMNDGFDVLGIELIDDIEGSDHKAVVAHLTFNQ